MWGNLGKTGDRVKERDSPNPQTSRGWKYTRGKQGLRGENTREVNKA
jgi:hypothetical protein